MVGDYDGTAITTYYNNINYIYIYIYIIILYFEITITLRQTAQILYNGIMDFFAVRKKFVLRRNIYKFLLMHPKSQNSCNSTYVQDFLDNSSR